jgi:glucan phosphoethanolaminetransferase (alkaline phosphatase superfamily)
VSRPWLTALGAGVALLMLAVALMNSRLGSLVDLPHSFAYHSPYLLVWRLLLYATIATLWWRVDRLRTEPAARAQWRRLAAICALLILAIELSRGMPA